MSIIAKEDIREQIDNLKADGHTVYSISRLNNFNSCPYCYHLTYNLKLPQVQNPYSVMGDVIHDAIENIYKGEKSKEDMVSILNETLLKCELFGSKFPSEKIKANWVADMTHFVNNFKKLDGDFITEKGFVFDIDGVFMQGFIDAINRKDELLNILDWKTSSAFKGEKLKDAGRQLILYKLAIESLFNMSVDKVGWDMLKYVYVCYGNRKKMCSRRQWVKDISNLLETDLKKLGIDIFLISMYIDQAIKSNSLDGMPIQIQEKYSLEDCIVYYNITDDLVDECKTYISNTVKKIEDRNNSIDDDWEHTEINAKTLFFCEQLCGQRDNCKYLKEYKNL